MHPLSILYFDTYSTAQFQSGASKFAYLQWDYTCETPTCRVLMNLPKVEELREVEHNETRGIV